MVFREEMNRFFSLGFITAMFVGAPAVAQDSTATSSTSSVKNVNDSDDVWSSSYDSLDHVMVLDQLNTESDELQNKIGLLRDRVDLLRESVIMGAISPSRTTISHKNDMGDSFEIQSIEYRLDGETIYTKDGKGEAIDLPKDLKILDGVLAPGEHIFETRVLVSGTGRGYYSYFRGYRFRLASKYRLNVAEGRLTGLTVSLYARPDMSLKPKDRLAIKYQVDVGVNDAK